MKAAVGWEWETEETAQTNVYIYNLCVWSGISIEILMAYEEMWSIIQLYGGIAHCECSKHMVHEFAWALDVKLSIYSIIAYTIAALRNYTST